MNKYLASVSIFRERNNRVVQGILLLICCMRSPRGGVYVKVFSTRKKKA
jgi:hypothetical protein